MIPFSTANSDSARSVVCAGAELDASGGGPGATLGFVAAPKVDRWHKNPTAMMGESESGWQDGHLFGVGAAHQAGLVVVGRRSFLSLSG